MRRLTGLRTSSTTIQSKTIILYGLHTSRSRFLSKTKIIISDFPLLFSVIFQTSIHYIEEIKHVFRAFIAWWKPRRMFGRIREQISENPRRSRGFLPAREFSQTLPRLSTGYGGTDNMFYFFCKFIIFSVNKEKDDIRNVYYKVSQLGEGQKPHCDVIFVPHNTCWPINN